MQRLSVFAFLILLAVALPACGEPPPSGQSPPPVAPLPLIAVPPGFHAAVAAILPGDRVIEYAEPDTHLLDRASVIAIRDGLTPPRGFSPMGSWLEDRLVLALRLDLGPADDTPVLPSPSDSSPAFLSLGSGLDRLRVTLSDEGPGRAALTEGARDRLQGSEGESGAAWLAFTMAVTPAVTDSPLSALIDKRAEAAVFDPGTLARFLLLSDHWLRDRVALAEFPSTRRPLTLWVRTGDPVAFDTGRRLMHQAANLKSLGYSRAE